MSYFIPHIDELINLLKQYRSVYAASAVCASKRSELPTGTSRAKVTTLNARWARLAEERDRLENKVNEVLRECPFKVCNPKKLLRMDDIKNVVTIPTYTEPQDGWDRGFNEGVGRATAAIDKFFRTTGSLAMPQVGVMNDEYREGAIKLIAQQIADELPNCGIDEHGISVIIDIIKREMKNGN
jgi:hypothetical protein